MKTCNVSQMKQSVDTTKHPMAEKKKKIEYRFNHLTTQETWQNVLEIRLDSGISFLPDSASATTWQWILFPT